MSSYNNNVVVLNGRLTKAPKLFEQPGSEAQGEPVYSILHLAVSVPKAGGEQRTVYPDVKVWNGQARACVKHLGKGSFVSVLGSWDQYDNPETKERWNFISAERVEFIGYRPKKGGEDA
jgi:single-stranded DNA-binding protein